MKYVQKCPCCKRLATRKYRGVWFCESCCKELRRPAGGSKGKRQNFFVTERLVFSFGRGSSEGIYAIERHKFSD